MTNKKKRTKKVTISHVSLDTAQEASQKYAVSQNKLSSVEAKMNEEINKIKSKYQEQITELQESLEEPIEILEVYAKENQESWGKKKSIELLHCIIGFRTGMPKVDKDKKFTWDAITELMQKNKSFKSFIRSKVEIDKEAILACKDEVQLKSLQDDCYVFIKQDETFFINPKVEEVTNQ